MKNRKEGQMSNEWTMVRLEDVCNKASSNISLNKVAGDLGEYPLFGASGLAKNIDFYHQEKEYIAIVKDGAGVGRVMMLPSKSSIVGTMQYLLPKSNIHINYLCYILKQLDLAKYASGATIPHIYFKDYSKEDVFLPPIAKQREIAEVLDKASELVEKRKAQLAELDLLAESVFYDMFGDPVTNPKGWEFDCLKKHLKVIGGYAFKSTAYVEDGIPVLRIGNINSGVLKTVGVVFYEEHDSLSRYIVRPNDIVISLTGTVGKEDYGNICILDDTYSMYYLNQRNAKLDLNSTIDKWYLAFMLKNPQVKNKLTGISRGIRQANISNGDIENIIIPIAPIELQNQFATIIEKIEEQKAKAKEALKESENLFQRLMQDMFNPDYHNS